MAKPHILVVEDEPSIQEGLRDVLLFHGYDVEVVGDGLQGLALAKTGRYHLILLDVMLPGMNGLDVCRALREKDKSQPVLMLTAKGDEEDVVKGLQLGADDYVSKPFSIRELLARIESLLRRSGKWSREKETLVWGDLKVDPTNMVAHIGENPVELTRREVDLLLYLMAHADRPVGRQELLKEVWGYGHTQMDTRTVDIHVTKLRRKIEKDPEEPRLIETVRGEGYRMGKQAS